jgi:hypothetical protein
MRSLAVVEVEIATQGGACLADAVVGPQIDLLVFDDRHSRSTKTLSRNAPRPSMLMAMPLAASRPVKAELVNCEPWSM